MKNNHWSIAKKAFSALFIISVMMIIALGGCTAKTTTTPPVITTAPPETSAPFTPVITTTPPATTPTVTLTPTTPPPASTTPAPTTAAPATPQTILSITGGDVFIMRAGTTDWVLATEGTTLQPGDSIRSAADATAEVTFFEGSTIELKGDTQISLTDISLSDTGSTTIHLKQIIGDTVSRVKKLTDSSSTYEVETQAAVAAVRGSVMELIVLADGTTIVENIEGDIRATAQGVEVTIPEGYKVTIVPGQAPGQPEPIISPTPTPTTAPPGPGPQIVYTARVTTAVLASSTTAFVGDTVTYSYSITNIGNVGLSSVGATGTVTGPAALSSGDVNGNNILDPGETWVLVGYHVVTAADPLELVNHATFTVTVPQNLNAFTLSDQVTVFTSSKSGIKIILTWDTNGTDIDSHTIRPGGEYNSYSDCFYDNLTPDWGEYGHPKLDHDNTTGYGPEQTTLTDPGTGSYHFMVDYYGGSLSTIATVEIYINGVLAATYSHTLANDTVPPWDCAIIYWSPSGAHVFVPPAITTTSLPDGQEHVAYSQTLTATGGYGTYHWSIISGRLPSGLDLSDAGVISGTPGSESANIYNITVRMTDSLGNTVTQALSLVVNPPVSPTPTPTGTP